MNESVAFIIFYDDERYLEECVYYINKLQVPHGIHVEIMGVGGISGNEQGEGYNAAMRGSNAKYKVYLDCHLFIICDTFLYEMIDIFHSNGQIGMFGICGYTGKMEEMDIGRVLLWDGYGISQFHKQETKALERVSSLGNMLMATQYDMEWAEDCGGGTHCRSLAEKGYQTVVPYQTSSWCLYDFGGEGLDEIEKEYRFHLRRVDICHDLESAALIERLLLDGKIKYEEHMKNAESMSFTKNITGYFWEDFLLGGRKRNKYLLPDGKVWMDSRTKNVMHIVMAFNHPYTVYAAVMLQSLYENNPLCEVHVHILQCELVENDKKVLVNQAGRFGNQVEFYGFDRDWIPEGAKVTEEWSMEAYFRLYMTELLPAHVDRVLYLDVDIIINKPLYDFYFMDMQDYEIVGCRDFSRVLHEEFEDKRKELFAGLYEQENFIYFNSGVMLVDMKKLRKKVSGADYMKAVRQLEGKLMAPDQDILNLFHWEMTGLVDEYRYDFFNACLKGVQPEEVKQAASIIHYAGPKPWVSNDIKVHAHRIWWEYAVRTKCAADLVYHTIVRDKNVIVELTAGLERAKYCMHVPFMSCDVNGIKYIGSSLDLVMMRSMYNKKENWSKKEIDAFFELSDKYYGRGMDENGGIFLDIGGNIGTTSIYVLKEKSPKLKVIAFEPVKDNIRMFKANCILNDIDDKQITLVEKALSNECSDKVVEKDIFNPGMAHIVDKGKENRAYAETVESIALDDYLRMHGTAYQDIRYIWMDVEGFEGFVVDGAKELLSSSKIPVCMEFVPKYLRRQGSYELLLQNLKRCYTHFIWLNEYLDNNVDELREIGDLENFSQQLGDGQADIFLVKWENQPD
ncbi:MAG: FkbM family methyltransferase [Lachnospiraceae bacterium]|jgi:FkbM family methyltransferase|nr:FkbM family methyltransferase [Lachnospiraceae bacterium]